MPAALDGKMRVEGANAFLHLLGRDFKSSSYISPTYLSYSSSIGTMFKALVVASCLASVLAFPQHQNQNFQQLQRQQQPPQQQQQQQQQQNLRSATPPVPIVSLDNSVNHDGSYTYSFEGGDGTRAEQSGQLKTIGQEAGEVSRGSYSYVGDDGKTYSVSYTADETGYHPVGDHLPQPPPIPEAILRSLEYLATAPPPKEENN